MRRTLRNCANWIALLVGNSAGYSINATRGKPKANVTQEEATNWALKKIESAMDKPKQPTAAAMRAAEEINREVIQGNVDIEAYPDHSVAEIIDRETGLPELLEAFKAIKDLAKYAESAFNPDIIKICDTAIGKAENEH